MSCLLLPSLEVNSSDCHNQARRSAAFAPVPSQRHSIPHRCTDHRVQGRVPPLPAHAAGRTDSSSLPNKPGMSRVSLQAQYQAFVRFAVTSSAALSAVALNGPRSGTFTRLGSLDLPRELRHPPARSTGPVTLNRCCEAERSRSARIIQAVFRVPLRLYRGKNRPVTTLAMPARSAFGAPAGARPAATIKPSTSLLWSCPTSTTMAPPGTSKRVASGMIAR